MKNIKASFGGLYAVVNNAGMTLDKLLMLTKADDFDRIFNVNMKPVFLLSKLASKMMLKKREGRIINISSVVGFKGNPGQSLYTATKGAITSFTKSVAAELAGAGITVNSVAPGFIKTAMTDQLNEQQQEAILSQIPMKKVGEPSDIANAVEFLLSEKASYITGTTIHVNGGMF
jgi:3-oxoacyl-[acyl-carrier protein] reductase